MVNITGWKSVANNFSDFVRVIPVHISTRTVFLIKFSSLLFPALPTLTQELDKNFHKYENDKSG